MYIVPKKLQQILRSIHHSHISCNIPTEVPKKTTTNIGIYSSILTFSCDIPIEVKVLVNLICDLETQ